MFLEKRIILNLRFTYYNYQYLNDKFVLNVQAIRYF